MKLEIREYSTLDGDFSEELARTLSRGSEFDPKIDQTVRDIIEKIRNDGDDALLALTQQHDHSKVTSVRQLEIAPAAMREAADRVNPDVLSALHTAADRIRRFHERQLETSWQYEDDDGSVYGQRLTPIQRVGIYVPGGLAAYPSTVLMTAVPARVAGVEQIVMVVPAPRGVIRDSVLASAHVAGVDRAFMIGGAQAVAALAFGTQTVPTVDKIVGPGNAWVSAAKRQVFGHVGIDLIAGPSEVVVVCDDGSNAEWAAMDMFAQAEHDYAAQSVLLSTSREKIAEVRAEMENMLDKMERREIIAKSLSHQGALIHVGSRDELASLIDRIAPEHLELMVDEPMELANQVRNAGAIFVGDRSAEVLGDYCAGPNHVLPTSGAARFSSPLGVYDFIKRTSLIGCSSAGSRALAATASVLATEEQLTAHARSARYRMEP